MSSGNLLARRYRHLIKIASSENSIATVCCKFAGFGRTCLLLEMATVMDVCFLLEQPVQGVTGGMPITAVLPALVPTANSHVLKKQQ